MDERLYVTCRHCGSEAPTRFELSTTLYEVPPDAEHEVPCPACGRTATYTRQAFHLPA